MTTKVVVHPDVVDLIAQAGGLSRDKVLEAVTSLQNSGRCEATVSMLADNVTEAEREAFTQLFNPDLTCRLQAGHAGAVHVDATYFPTRPWRIPTTLAATK